VSRQKNSFSHRDLRVTLRKGGEGGGGGEREVETVS